jgi:hypothetical protein
MAFPSLPPAPAERRTPPMAPPPVFSPGAPPEPAEPPASRSTRRTWVLIAIISAAVILAGAIGDYAIGHRGDYAFLEMRGPHGSATRWNPCAPIHYRVNLNDAPPGALDDLQETIRRTTAATHVPFVSDGTTDETPVQWLADPTLSEPGPDGPRWRPVLVSWETRDAWLQLGGSPSTKGFAEPIAVNADGYREYVTGLVVIDADPAGFADFPAGFDQPGSQGVVLLHEFGHLMGLAHVQDTKELMTAGGDGEPTARDWGPGDRAGLARLGRDAGCLQAPAPPEPGAASAG